MKFTKLYLILLTIALATLSFRGYLQEQILEKKISISFNNITLKKAIKQIEKESGVSFAYTDYEFF